MKVDQSTISERVAALPWGDVERNFLESLMRLGLQLEE